MCVWCDVFVSYVCVVMCLCRVCGDVCVYVCMCVCMCVCCGTVSILSVTMLFLVCSLF